MVKVLYGAPGRVIITCRVTSIIGGRAFSTTETGSVSLKNVAGELNNSLYRAKYNAIYRHMYAGGKSEAIAEIVDYDIMYFDKVVRRRRVAEGGKYYAIVTDKKTGRVVSRRRWRVRQDIGQ